MPKLNWLLSTEQLHRYEAEGYLVVKGLFTYQEVEEIRETFEAVSRTVVAGYFEPAIDAEGGDPLKRYPRVIHPHRFHDTAKKYMLHRPVFQILAQLLGEEALAAQSMYYYKPPGSRGQALHQDNFYLKVEPGNCIAAWTAIDPADEENGCMLVVPKTNEHEVVCPEQADENESFTSHYVRPPGGSYSIPVHMDPGDVLFFNGNLIHGSYRNKSKDRFRRAFICHYVNASADRIHQHYRPLYRGDGSTVDLEDQVDGGPCGVEFGPVYPH